MRKQQLSLQQRDGQRESRSAKWTRVDGVHPAARVDGREQHCKATVCATEDLVQNYRSLVDRECGKIPERTIREVCVWIRRSQRCRSPIRCQDIIECIEIVVRCPIDREQFYGERITGHDASPRSHAESDLIAIRQLVAEQMVSLTGNRIR